MKQSEKNYKRIVIKVGSSLFYGDDKKLDYAIFESLAGQIAGLLKLGKQVVVVSSGAIALGMDMMNLKSRPKELAFLQASAALGQNLLMDNYSRAFGNNNLKCGQVLLTWDDFDSRKRYLSARETLLTLLRLGSIPIVNENDTIAADEIKFGDNDRLSALVAALINADILIILSDVDGLLDKEKNLVKAVSEITPKIRELACPTDKKSCVGGMITKLDAAKIAVDSGIPCVIANGRQRGAKENIILQIVNRPAALGNWTLFFPKKGSLAAKERWIAFGTKPKGKIVVDDGAKAALMNKKSLLCVGIVAGQGAFEAGDIVSVVDKENYELARGVTNISLRHLDKVKGKRFAKEIIHRDNIVIL